ncbi:MAG TPA: lysylphosphatidylglycerol synthase transmembrane domain-containing protein [Ilumatobacter sp.]
MSDGRSGDGLRLRHLAVGIAAALVAAAAMVTGVGRLAGYAAVGDAFSDAGFGWLAACVAGQVLVFAGYGGALRWAIRVDDGPRLPVAASVKVVMASFAATQVFAFGGVGGLAVVYWVFRRMGRDRLDAAVRLIGLNTAVYLVFGVIAWSAAGAALATAKAPAGLTVPWLVGLPVVVAAARWFTAPGRVARFTTPGERLAGRALATGVGAADWVRRLPGRPEGAPLFAWALCYWAGDLISLWAALRAFGADPGVIAVTVAYTTGYLVQSLPIPLIATTGVDTATTFLLHVVGVPLEVALLGVVAHRVFAFWLPVIPGSLFALSLRRLAPIGAPAG